MLSKGVYQLDNKLVIVKGATPDNFEPFSEVLGSRIFHLFSGLPTVLYKIAPSYYFTDIKTFGLGYVSICEKLPFTIHRYHQFISNDLIRRGVADTKRAGNLDTYLEYGLSKDYLYIMLIFDAWIGNIDRHWNNFDVVNNNGKLGNAPVLDFGASLLFDVEERELKPKLLIGEDSAKPIRDTHKEQIEYLRRIWGTPKYFSINKSWALNWFVSQNQDILRLMSNKRVMTLLRYLDRRFDLYIKPYNTV